MGLSGAGGREAIVLYEVRFSRPPVAGVLTWAGIDRLDFARRLVVQNE